MPCEKCDSVTTYHLSGTYQLLILPPRGHCYSKLLKHLTENNFDINKKDSGIIELLFTAERAQDIGHALERCYSQAELEDSKAVLLPIDIADRNVERVLNHTHSLKKLWACVCLNGWLDLLKITGYQPSASLFCIIPHSNLMVLSAFLGESKIIIYCLPLIYLEQQNRATCFFY